MNSRPLVCAVSCEPICSARLSRRKAEASRSSPGNSMLASSRAATSSGTLERSSRNASSRRCTRISLPSYNQSGSSLLKFKAFVRLFTHIQLLPVLENGEETTLVGGQAVMEGVMMRSPHSYCVAVRKPDGSIATEESPIPRLSEKYPIFRWPVLRGLGTLGGAMALG